MSKLKIERPDWSDLQRYDFGPQRLDDWFNTYVQPVNKMLRAGVEVRASGIDGFGFPHWAGERNFCDTGTHKGLLINIEPIVKDSWQQFLKDIVQDENIESIGSLRSRAERLLEQG